MLKSLEYWAQTVKRSDVDNRDDAIYNLGFQAGAAGMQKDAIASVVREIQPHLRYLYMAGYKHGYRLFPA